MLLDNIPAALYKHLPCLIIPANVCEEPAIPPCLPPASASLALLCFGTEQVKGEKDEKHHFSHPLIKFQQSCVFSNNTEKKKKRDSIRQTMLFPCKSQGKCRPRCCVTLGACEGHTGGALISGPVEQGMR